MILRSVVLARNMSYLHTHWRDVEAWRKEGLPLSTTSNEAAKMFDASLTQVVAHLEDDSVGGLQNSITRMLQADPDFGVQSCSNPHS